jgi:hypothetical protein
MHVLNYHTYPIRMYYFYVSSKNSVESGTVAHSCNPSYLGGGDREDLGGWRPAQTESYRDPHLNKQAGNGGVHLSFQQHGTHIRGSWSRPPWAKT